jgi:glycosyltransferase involved in cell wall biosynthesis
MRVAQIAPLYESVPPKKYGGTERVVSYLTEELVRQGHHVTLFASGDSITKAELVSTHKHSLRLAGENSQGLIPHLLMIEEVRKRASEFDIVHFHIDLLQAPMTRNLKTPALTTLHGRLDLPSLIPFYEEYIETAVVSISDAQRKPLPWLNWQGTVYHGLPKDLYSFHKKSRGYAAFIGRISPEKRADRAIEIARRAGIPLKIAAKVDDVDKKYFEAKIKPLIEKSRDVEFIGEIDDKEKNDFLGNASMLLFPIDWPEPFGLVMIESMACGTPVIAFDNGSVPEVMRNGISGYTVHSVDEAVKYAEKIGKISRTQCRKEFESRFSAEIMAKNYVSLYQKMIDENKSLGKNSYGSLSRREIWKTSFNTTIKSI